MKVADSYSWYQANIYLFNANDRNTRKRCEMCSKLTIKITERHPWRHISQTFFWCFCGWLWTSKCYLGTVLTFIIDYHYITFIILFFPFTFFLFLEFFFISFYKNIKEHSLFLLTFPCALIPINLGLLYKSFTEKSFSEVLWKIAVLIQLFFNSRNWVRLEGVVWMCSVKKVFLEISQNSQVFSYEFCEISKNTFFYRTPPVAASTWFWYRFR